MPTKPTEDLKPFDDGVALAGPERPKDDGFIEHLIRYLLTVHKRFGNTCVTTNLQWGATALHQMDRYRVIMARCVDAYKKDPYGDDGLVSRSIHIMDKFLKGEDITQLVVDYDNLEESLK